MTKVRIRLIRTADSATIAHLLDADREHLRASRPADDSISERERIDHALAERAAGRRWPGVIESDGDVVGRIALNNIQLGVFRSAFVSYWVAAEATGKGFATRAVADILDLAFDDLALHRVDAFVRPANAASLKVLERNGFEEIGVARRHTHVGGQWQDELLLQRLAPWDDGVTLPPELSF